MIDTNEIPQPTIASNADDFADAARYLFGEKRSVLSMYMTSSFAIELYLKALCSSNVYTECGDMEGAFIVTAEANNRGHKLVALFNGVDGPIQTYLSDSFSVAHKGQSLVELLTRYNDLFETCRYPFEKDNADKLDALSNYAINEIVGLATFFQKQVKEMPKVRTCK